VHLYAWLPHSPSASTSPAPATSATRSSCAIELTKNENKANVFSVGRALYARAVPLWDNTTGEVASFSSKFTFQIRPNNNTEVNLCKSNLSNSYRAADGMAFFLGHYPLRLTEKSVNDLLDLEVDRAMEMIRKIAAVKPVNDSDINALGVGALECLCEDLVPSSMSQEEDVDMVSEGYMPPYNQI
jgi:hypothetical protein